MELEELAERDYTLEHYGLEQWGQSDDPGGPEGLNPEWVDAYEV